MADLKASVIYQPGEAIYDRVTLAKKAAADDIQKGDFLKSDGANGVEKVTAAADDGTFCGVSAMQSADANGPSQILVYTRCIVECPMESAAYNFGAGLKYNTNGTLELDTVGGAANTIAWAWETSGTTTTLKCLVDVRALTKLFAVSA